MYNLDGISVIHFFAREVESKTRDIMNCLGSLIPSREVYPFYIVILAEADHTCREVSNP